MDEIDRANQDIEFYEKHRRTQYKKEAEPTGYCLFCGEELTGNKRWCDAECRNFWEKENRRNQKWQKYR